MTHVIQNDAFNAVSLQAGGFCFKVVGEGGLKIEKIECLDVLKSKAIDFGSWRPAVKQNNLVVYKTGHNLASAWRHQDLVINFSNFIIYF